MQFSRPWFLILTAFLLAFREVRDSDLWWHLAAGKWMVENRALLTIDPFSFTFEGRSWISITWFYEIFIYLFYQITNDFLLVVLIHALLVSVAAYFSIKIYQYLIKDFDNDGLSFFTTFFFLVSFVWIEIRWNQRPEVFSYALGLGLLYLLLKESRGERTNLFWLSFLQIFWSNVHGFFIFGPIFCLSFLITIKNKVIFNRFLSIFTVLVFSSFINPYGLKGVLFPLHLLNVLKHPFYQSTISEATQPFKGYLLGFDSVGLMIWFALVFIFLFFNWKKLKQNFLWHFPWILIFLELSWTALSARRNIAPLMFWTLPWMAYCLRLLIHKFRVTSKKFVFMELATMVLLIFGILTNGIRWGMDSTRFGYSLAKDSPQNLMTPLSEIFEKNKNIKFFANTEVSNFLLFFLNGFRSYIDSRFAEVFPVEHFKRYMEVLAHPFLIEEEVKKYDLSGVILFHWPPLAKGLVQYLSRSTDWRLYYGDEYGVIFLKNDFEVFNTARIRSDKKASSTAQNYLEAHVSLSNLNIHATQIIFNQYKLDKKYMKFTAKNDLSRSLAHLASLMLLLGETKLAKQSLDHASLYTPDHPLVWDLRCVQGYLDWKSLSLEKKPLLDLKNQITQSELLCLNALRKKGDPSITNQILGLIAFDTDRYELAIHHFKNVIQLEPLSFEGHLMLGRSVARAEKNSESAKRYYLQASRLRPFDPTILEELKTLEFEF